MAVALHKSFWKLFSCVLAFAVAAWPIGKDADASILIGFGTITSGSLYFLLQDQKPFSLAQIFWLFCLLFLGLIPSMQYRFNSFSWDVPVWDQYIQQANVLILLSMAVFAGVYHFYSPKIKCTPYNLHLHTSWHKIGFAIAVIASVIIIALLGLPNLWTRYRAEHAATQYDASWFLPLMSLCKMWMVYFFFCVLMKWKQGKVSTYLLVGILALMLITHFPLSMNRLSMGIVWGGALLIVWKGWTKHIYLFRSLLLVAICILFPLLNIIRYADKKNETAQASFYTSSKVFSTGDFDAYTNLTHTLHVGDELGITIGKQLMGALLFFIPRSQWPTKPIGSGAFVYGQLHSDKFNVSSPLLAEGYINFGIPGALLFTAVFALLAKYADTKRWDINSHLSILFQAFYIIILLFSLQLLRGDLMSSFAQLANIILVGMLMRWILFTKEKRIPL